jgi:hypothetical protein
MIMFPERLLGRADLVENDDDDDNNNNNNNNSSVR